MTPLSDGQDMTRLVEVPDRPTPEEYADLPVLALCTQDADCGADVDAHLEGCPVERQLREEFGY